MRNKGPNPSQKKKGKKARDKYAQISWRRYAMMRLARTSGGNCWGKVGPNLVLIRALYSSTVSSWHVSRSSMSWTLRSSEGDHSTVKVTAPSQHRHSTVTEANRHQSIGPQAPTSKSAPGKRGAFKEEQSVHRFVVVGLGRKYDRNGGIKPKSRLYIDYIYLLPAQHVSKLSGCGIEGSRDDVWHQDLHGWTKPKPRDVKIKE